MKKILKQYLSIRNTVSFFSGFIVGWLVDPFNFFVVQREINVVSLLVTFILALYLANSIEKRNNIEKAEKEILIQDLNKFKDCFSERIGKFVEEDKLLLDDINLFFKNSRMECMDILSLAQEALDLKERVLIKKIESNIKGIWTLFTDSEVKKIGGKSYIFLNKDLKDEINVLKTRTGINLRKFSMKINNRV